MPVVCARRLKYLLRFCLLILLADCQGCSETSEAASAVQVRDAGEPRVGAVAVSFNGRPAPLPSAQVCTLAVIARESGPQMAVMEQAGIFTVDLCQHEEIRLSIPLRQMRVCWPSPSRRPLLVEAMQNSL